MQQKREQQNMKNNELREQNRKIMEELNALRYNDDKQGQNVIQSKDRLAKPRTRYASIITLQKEEEMLLYRRTGHLRGGLLNQCSIENLKIDDIGGPTKAIIPLWRGGVLIESYNDGQRRRIGELLKKDSRIQYREVKNVEPVIQLRNIVPNKTRSNAQDVREIIS